MPKRWIKASMDGLESGLNFVETTLEKYHIHGKHKMEAMLISEEAMVRLIDNADEDGQVQISIHRWYSTAVITMSAPGREMDDEEFRLDMDVGGSMGHGSEAALRNLLLHAFADKAAFSRRGHYNFVKISAGARERVFALRTMLAFLGAILVSLVLLPFISEAEAASFAEKVLIPLQTVFLNALQMVTGPAVFFSVMAAVAQFRSFSDPGRVTLKIFGSYLLTSVGAVFLGILLFRSFRPSAELTQMVSILNQGEIASWVRKDSLLAMLADVVPSNIVDPFRDTNSTQLMLMAVLSGLALGRVGDYSKMLRDIADALNKFFSGTVEIISGVIPIAVFPITLLMMLYFELTAVVSALQIFLLVLCGFVIMFLLYMLLLGVFGRLNPITFIRKYAPHMLSTFWGGSSINAISENMLCCEKEFGVPSGIYSFSIPVGAIMNLDGNCIYLTIVGLLMARLCGAEIQGSDLLTVVLMVIILSLGAPITPGSVLLSLTLLLNQMGVSLMVLSIVLGINSVLEMLLAACNTVGDMVTTLLVAKSEHLLDLNVYKSVKDPSKSRVKSS